jgi:hypothetical protein
MLRQLTINIYRKLSLTLFSLLFERLILVYVQKQANVFVYIF